MPNGEPPIFIKRSKNPVKLRSSGQFRDRITRKSARKAHGKAWESASMV
ncbi:hypothetical protein [Rhizobium sp. 18055]|nr:hypothetical protein [Rhizobium sp. 18055]